MNRFCIKGNGEEVQVMATATGATPLPTAYNDCHAHGTNMFCVAPDGTEVEVLAAGGQEETSEVSGTSEEGPGEGESCHFHAGVE